MSVSKRKNTVTIGVANTAIKTMWMENVYATKSNHELNFTTWLSKRKINRKQKPLELEHKYKLGSIKKEHATLLLAVLLLMSNITA